MAKSSIEWTGRSWNLVTGCSEVSPGCKNCYARTMHRRLHGMDNQPKYTEPFSVVRIHPETLAEPLNWKKPQLVFVCSMSDLFHPDVPSSFIIQVFEVMNACPQHTFQVLTKRPERLLQLAPCLNFTPNIWVGTSVEQPLYYPRISILQQVPAAVRFLSLEPLLKPMDTLPLEGIDWVITGGESAPKARPVEADWVRSIRDQCAAAGVKFFFKQWGGPKKKKAGRLLDGRTYDDMPPRAKIPTAP